MPKQQTQQEAQYARKLAKQYLNPPPITYISLSQLLLTQIADLQVVVG